MIPRIIHQTWKTADLPEAFRRYSLSWREQNPDWEYRFWSDRDLLEFVTAHYPEQLELFCSYRHGVQRADAGRYMLLHHFGGVYADLDTECIRPLEDLTPESRVILCREPDTHWAATAAVRGQPFMLFNGVMVSPAGHSFWRHLLGRMADTRHAADVLDSTGPCLLTGAVLSWPEPETVRLEAADFFDPVDLHGQRPDHQPVVPGYAIHHWAGTWLEKPKPLRRRQRKFRDWAYKYYRAKAGLLGGKHLDPATARAAVAKSALAAPLPAGNNIALLVPVTVAAPQLAELIAAIAALDFPKARLKLVFGAARGGSEVYEQLEWLTAPLKTHYRDIIRLPPVPGNFFGATSLWPAARHRLQCASRARLRNRMIDLGLDAADDWALWLDATVCKFPADIIAQLLAAKARIVIPDCALTPGGPSRDHSSSIFLSGRRDDYEYCRLLHAGLFRPPPDFPQRLKLSDLRHSDRVPLDSVGGAMLLVDAALHRGGLRFPELPYDDLIETEAFGRLAKDCGVTPIGLPRLAVQQMP